MFISEVMTSAPQDERGALETKTYQELERLNIKYERVDNDTVEAMEECVEISEKLGAEIRKTIVVSWYATDRRLSSSSLFCLQTRDSTQSCLRP